MVMVVCPCVSVKKSLMVQGRLLTTVTPKGHGALAVLVPVDVHRTMPITAIAAIALLIRTFMMMPCTVVLIDKGSVAGIRGTGKQVCQLQAPDNEQVGRRYTESFGLSRRMFFLGSGVRFFGGGIRHTISN